MKKILKLMFSPVLFVNKLVKETKWYNSNIINKDNYPTNEWYRNHEERNYDVVNIGSSSALYCFNYSNLNIKAFNWALQPQSMEFGYKILQNYFSILKKNGIVIIPFSPFSSLSVEGKWSKTANDRYYGILSSELLDNYQEIARRMEYPIIFQFKESLKRLLKDIPSTGIKYNLCRSEEDFEKDSKVWIRMWMEEFAIVDLNQPLSLTNLKGSENRRQTILEIINFCLERELKPVIVIPPMHPALSSKFSKEFRKNYLYSFIEKINNENVTVLDYIDSPNFKEDKYYCNSFFMNVEGAKKFTKRVLSDCGIL